MEEEGRKKGDGTDIMRQLERVVETLSLAATLSCPILLLLLCRQVRPNLQRAGPPGLQPPARTCSKPGTRIY